MDLQRSVKYALDRLASWLLVVLLAPLLALIAAAIRIESPGNPLLLQERAGAGGQLFTTFRYRTRRAGSKPPGMLSADDASDEPRPGWAAGCNGSTSSHCHCSST